MVMDSYFGEKQQFNVKVPYRISYLLTFCLTRRLIDGLESCGLLVDYCDVLSAVWTLIPTALIHYRGSFGEQVP